MTHEWIKAPLALAYVTDNPDDDIAKRRICERVHRGLIASKAERLIYKEQEQLDRLMGREFWWAEGHEALEQDWETGYFSTWIDGKFEAHAYGVSFDFGPLTDLVPAEKKAEALARMSVSGSDDWISAARLYGAIMTRVNPLDATAVLAEACRLGQLGARAMRASGEKLRGEFRTDWVAIEWDVPLWFWRDFATARHGFFQWHIGKVNGEGRLDGATQRIKLQGIHFHKSGLVNLGFAPTEASNGSDAKRGRKPEYDWPAATQAIWGKILRGELIPENQAAVERALQAHLTVGDKEPSESTVRPYAKPIWDEYSKA